MPTFTSKHHLGRLHCTSPCSSRQ